ncbi:hypothetical protein OG539_00910 [Actinacidiphila glaucinigra]|uniref:hypothetical protein n=1 Tax=Actinacidiphila glaucinigra TaxID=235986 RepID=UPI002DD89C7A|nr:hypothetical protein [Actinacidiphila glaucinigra]WSD64992.1 hypothetical protein OIE69_42040 [Actinacidiphila glaucinigra]
MTGGPCVRSTGFSVKALLHLARGRRIRAETRAILGGVPPVIGRSGPARTTTLVVPSRSNPCQALPADLVERLAHRTGIELVLSPGP